MAGGELDPDHASVTVPDDNRFRDAELLAKPGDVVRERRQVVAVLRSVAAPAAAQVQRRHRMRGFEVVELWLEEGVIAAPAMDEQQRWLPAPLLLVEQAEAVPPCVRHEPSLR